MKDKVETLTLGGMTVLLHRAPSVLVKHALEIRGLLGKALPDDFAAFYETGDGLRYRATGAGGQVLGEGDEILGLAQLFANFRPHRALRTIDAFYEDDAMSEQPFYEELWSEEFPLESRKDLERLNTLKRSKVLVSVPGESVWLTVDFFDPKGAPYRLAIAQDGCEHYPLDLSFPDFVEHFRRFGASRWYLAFAGKKAEKAMNIDFTKTLEESLAPYAAAWPEEVAALVNRVKPARRRKA